MILDSHLTIGMFGVNSLNIILFGSTGMLGIQFVKLLTSKKKINLFATIRNSKDIKLLEKFTGKKLNTVKWLKFDAENYNIKNLKKIIKNKDFIINCIGKIKPYIRENDKLSIKSAIKLNSIFPNDLADNAYGSTKIYQIATDCVYDGSSKFYNENSTHNPEDVYGKTKSLGEIKNLNFYNLRCSIVGPEIKNFNSLLEWFLKQTKNAKINGFSNHKWNGITTKAFAKIVISIIENKTKIPNLIHIVPKSLITKYELLIIFRRVFSKNILIKKTMAKKIVDRTLSTLDKKINKTIWIKAGYKKIPTIEDLINEIK